MGMSDWEYQEKIVGGSLSEEKRVKMVVLFTRIPGTMKRGVWWLTIQCF